MTCAEWNKRMAAANALPHGPEKEAQVEQLFAELEADARAAAGRKRRG